MILSSEQLSILVVDDDEVLSRALLLGLSRNHKKVDSVSSVQAALEVDVVGEYDVILCDWDLPDGAGSDVVDSTQTPIVIYSGGDHRVIGKRGAYVPCIKKPQSFGIISSILYKEYLSFQHLP